MQQQRAAAVPQATPAPDPDSLRAVDVAFGVLAQAVATSAVLGRPLRRLARPVVHVVLRPPLVPSLLQPATWLERAANQGVGYRREVVQELEAALDVLTPALVSELVRRVNLTELVQENVDLVEVAQGVIADIDLPELIRESTAVVASDTLLGVRMQSISGDDAITRAMDRVRVRLARGQTAPTTPGPAAAAEASLIADSEKPDTTARTT